MIYNELQATMQGAAIRNAMTEDDKKRADEWQIGICTEIINLALRLEDSRTRLLIMSRADDLRQSLRTEKKKPELI